MGEKERERRTEGSGTSSYWKVNSDYVSRSCFFPACRTFRLYRDCNFDALLAKNVTALCACLFNERAHANRTVEYRLLRWWWWWRRTRHRGTRYNLSLPLKFIQHITVQLGWQWNKRLQFQNIIYACIALP